MKDKIEQKLTIDDYVEKYSSKESNKMASGVIKVIVPAMAIAILACLFFLFKEAYDINEYVGYGVGAFSIVAFIGFFVVPVVKLYKQQRFHVDVTTLSSVKAKKHNARVRRELAVKIIDCYTATEDDAGWYTFPHVDALVKAMKSHDDKALKSTLDEVYKTDVKSAAKKLITKSAVRSGLYSAASQSDTLDTVLITSVNLNLIKNIVYLYGFRPSESQLLRIYLSVMRSSLVAYGLNGFSIGKTVGEAAKGIPILGSVISTLVDSSVQGLVNGTLTAVIGHNTIKCLVREFNLQSVLDDIEVNVDDEDFRATCESIKEELKAQQKVKTVRQKEPVVA